MRRIITIGTAVAVLVTASVALAASFNTYTASLTFNPTKPGSASKPVPVGFRQVYTAGGTNGNRAAPLTDIKTSIYGLVSNAKFFKKTCSISQINAAKNDTSCPKAALVAEGPVNALLGAGITPKAGGTPCNPYLHVWNSGPGKLTFFFVIFGKYQCAGLHTGASAPYPGFVSRHNGFLVTDVPLPPDVSTEAGGLKGVYAALIKEDLTWFKLTTKVGGKTVGYQSSVACKGGKRPWKVVFTAQNYSHGSGSSTISGSSKC